MTKTKGNCWHTFNPNGICKKCGQKKVNDDATVAVPDGGH
jgi:hypothetical protein